MELNDKQKEALSMLMEATRKINECCEENDDFNDFFSTLDVYSRCAMEVQSSLKADLEDHL